MKDSAKWAITGITGVAIVLFGALLFVGRMTKSPESVITDARLNWIKFLLTAHVHEHGTSPTNATHLGSFSRRKAMLTEDGGLPVLDHAYDSQDQLVDGWGRPFQISIETAGRRVIVMSLGANGCDDGGKYDDRLLVQSIDPQ